MGRENFYSTMVCSSGIWEEVEATKAGVFLSLSGSLYLSVYLSILYIHLQLSVPPGDIPGELPPHTPERNLDNPPTRHTIYIFCKTSARGDNLYPLTGGLFGSHTRVEGGELLLDRNRSICITLLSTSL